MQLRHGNFACLQLLSSYGIWTRGLVRFYSLDTGLNLFKITSWSGGMEYLCHWDLLSNGSRPQSRASRQGIPPTFVATSTCQYNTRFRLSDTANLAMATWNCSGLSKVKKDLIADLNLDIVCVTETHGWRDTDPNVIYSDSPSKGDKFSGTALMLSNKLSKYVITSGSIGSRIVYCRFLGRSANIFLIGV